MPDEPGWYAHIPGWHSQHRWLATIDRWATSRTGRRACHRKISYHTLLRIATALAAYADHDTGRRCAPAQDTIAAETGCCRETVRRAEHILAAAGFLTLIHGGGNYTPAMHRQHARLRRAGHQLVKPHHCPRIRALTLPRQHTQTVDNVALPASGRSLQSSPSGAWTINARTSARGAAARPKTKQQRTTTGGPWRRHKPRPIELQRLTAALMTRLPWLGRDQHTGAVCDALNWAGIDPARWGHTAAGAADTLIEQLAQPAPIPTGDTCRNPLGWLHHALDRIDTDKPTPFEQRQTRRTDLQSEQEQDRAADTARHTAAIPLNESSAAASIRHTLANLTPHHSRHSLPTTPNTSPRAWRTE